MFRGLNTAASGMIAQQRRQDAITTNIANLQTPGFKQVNALQRSFPEVLISLIGGQNEVGYQAQSIGRMHTGVMIDELLANFAQGDLRETGQASDFALFSVVDGENPFFEVQNDQGEVRYTRNGQFAQNADGELVIATGERVLGTDGQPIALSLPLSEYFVDASGQFFNVATGNLILSQVDEPLTLSIVTVDNPHQLTNTGRGLYQLAEGQAGPVQADRNSVQIHQGYVERSNVDSAKVAVEMMTALRAYEANQKVIQMYDQSLDKAVNEVGRV